MTRIGAIRSLLLRVGQPSSANTPGYEHRNHRLPTSEQIGPVPCRGLHVAFYMHDLGGGGSERVALALMRQFVQRGVSVTLVLHADAGELRHLVPLGVSIVVLGTHRAAADFLPLVRFLYRARPDILISNLHHDNVVGLLARGVAHTRTRVVICLHSVLSEEVVPSAGWKYRILPSVYRTLQPWMAAIVAVSEGTAKDFARVCKVPRAQVTRIYNPVLDEDFAQKMEEKADHPWFRSSVPVFVSAARLFKQKDHVTLLHAFARHRRERNARLFLMGSGPEQGSLEALVKQLGIGEDVVFAGFIENPLPYFRAAAAFVLSSRLEGFGIAIVEALGCGTPVIATECPVGPAEILDGGRYGRLVPVGDVAALAAAFDEDLRAQWSRESLQGRAALFSATGSANAYLDLFRSLLRPGECARAGHGS